MKVKLLLVPVGTEIKSAETGSWRTFRPVLKKDLCTKCGLCNVFCPDGVILETDNHFQPDYVFCKGCGICAMECPSKAIEMIQE